MIRDHVVMRTTSVPCDNEFDGEENECDDDLLVACLFDSEEASGAINKQEWGKAARNDDVFVEIQNYVIEGWPREKTRLWSYGTTPHNTTGRAPFKLVRGRLAITQLQLYWTLAWKKWEEENMKEKETEMRKLVDIRQKRMRANYNARNAVKKMNVCVGDMVRVKYRKKGADMSKYSELKCVVKTKGTAVLLNNGRWWNESIVVGIRLSEPVTDHEVVHSDVPKSNETTEHSKQCKTSYAIDANSNPSDMSSAVTVPDPKGTVTTRRTIVPPVRFKDCILN
ncbi:hypothetical protein NDU88_004087 [Pleurodeles waltl]|uniref:Uncharacterized protein n=1 Tax=Pleurodeles waltl TaxID=8319 RepID=A0AAV7MSH2_PLEWA|nr:hypothetical protein NDU88_004087 [Pleurodeles waltl]